MNRHLCILSSLLLLLWTTSIRAQEIEYPSRASGVSSDSVYQLGDIDSVNLFNGNLTLNIPIGPTYSADGGLRWGLSLVYNSNAWFFEPQHCQSEIPNSIPPAFDNFHFGKPVPNARANAGIGWSLSLGRLLEPNPTPGRPTALRPGGWTYVSPDGGLHTFSDELHPGFPTDPDASDAIYTTDGSYLRMRIIAAGVPGCENVPANLVGNGCRIIDTPDGGHRTFVDLNGNLPDSADDWRLTQIRDSFGNTLDLTYNSHSWTLSDSYRTVVVSFDTNTDAFAYRRIESVTVPVFPGSAPTSTKTYDFTYTTQQINRHRYHEIADRCDFASAEFPELPTPAVEVDLLDRLVLPDGSFYEMAYDIDENPDGDQGSKSGALRKLRVPTGLWNHWDYGPYAFFNPRPPGLEFGTFDVNQNIGVVAKQWSESDDPASSSLGRWTYEQLIGGKEPEGPEAAGGCYQTTTVTDPLGHQTIHYFNTSNRTNRARQGLPYTTCNPGNWVVQSETCPESLAGHDCFLSREEFNYTPGQPLELVRRHYVIYDNDGTSATGERNNRVSYEATEFYDDPNPDDLDNENNPRPHWREVEHSQFDGVGHFRETRRASSFPTDAYCADGFSCRSRTDYNPETGTLNDPANPFVLPPEDGRWLFGTYTFIRTNEAPGHQAQTDYCFDSDGFLAGMRRRDGSQQSDTDILVRYDKIGPAGKEDGNIYGERTYGGDAFGSLPAGCATDPEEPGFSIVHEVTAGIRTKSSSVDDCGAEVLVHLDQAIDVPTGLVATRWDLSGVATAFTYDALGRLTEEHPADSAWTRHTYELPRLGDPAPVTLSYQVQRCHRGTLTCDLTEDTFTYDVLGRLRAASRQMPLTTDDTEVSQYFDYNPLGWPTHTSVWGLPNAETKYQDYDRFGRAGRIVAPDGSETVIERTGDRVATTTVQIRGVGGVINRQVTQVNDSKGRLVRVIESSGANGEEVETTYGYDEADRIVRVCVAPGSQAQCGQERVFNYDDRGFLASESQPETNTKFFTHDALGNVLTQRLAGDPQRQFGLDYRYDAAGRMTQVWGYNSPSQPRLLEERAYARSDENGPKGAGKLALTKRHNYVPDPADPSRDINIVVSETFAYAEQDGRVSHRTQRANNGVSFTLEVDSYDALGNIAALRYPLCAFGTGCENLGARTVDSTYTFGRLTTIEGAVSAISYHPDGQLARLDHLNGVNEILDRDSFGRLGELRTTGAVDNWETGSYGYDGAGNITAIGSESFRYDTAGRLASATIDLDPSSGTTLRTRTYGYDRFGNLTQIAGAGDAVGDIAVDASSNRLSAAASYDVAGNLVQHDVGGATYDYTYDAFNLMTELNGPTSQRAYLYTAGGERFATFDLPGGTESWTPRGLGNQVLSRLQRTESAWTWDRDYIFAGSRLVATASPGMPQEELRHNHLDHLGSTRLITDSNRATVAFHANYPFGQSAIDTGPGSEPLQFTGHERDDNGDGLRGDLDYMHARYYTSRFARFSSVDPVGGQAARPQSWNRYTYAANNPMGLVDPDGRKEQAWQSWLRTGMQAVTAKLQIAEATLKTKHAAAVSRLNRGVSSFQILDRIGVTVRGAKGLMSHGVQASHFVRAEVEGAEAAVTRLAPKVAKARFASRASGIGLAVEFAASVEISKFAESQEKEIARITSVGGPDDDRPGLSQFTNAEYALYSRLLAHGDPAKLEEFRAGEPHNRVADDTPPDSSNH